VVGAANGEGRDADLRSRAAVIDVRIAADPEAGPPYARALTAWRLDPVSMWFLHAAIAYEVVAELSAPTVASCARLACAFTGADPLDASAAALGRLARLALISVESGPPLHARSVRAVPRVLELALGVAGPPPVQIVRDPDVDLAACDAALAGRIADALGQASAARVIGDRACIPAIVAVAADHGLAAVLAGGADPASAVREALLADGVLVVDGGPLYHPAWSEAPRGVLVVT
jgi:hypothetical protein